MLNLDKALAEMQADPESFLRHYAVMIAGGVSGPGDMPRSRATFCMQDGNQSFRGFRTGGSGMIGLTRKRPKLRITRVPDGTSAGAGQVVFQAWYVPMTDVGGDRLAHHVVLPGSGGPNVALTSQMSGCTLGIGSAASDGSRLVAHVRPPPGQPDDQTYASMRDAASVGGMDALFERPRRAGSQSYGNAGNRATIIGVRGADGWRFYAQVYDHIARELFKVERL